MTSFHSVLVVSDIASQETSICLVFLYLLLPGSPLLPSIRLITRFCGRPHRPIHVPDLRPSPAVATGPAQIFRGNLSLPDSGWPRFVRMFDFSSGTPSLGWWEPVSRPRFCKLEIDIEAKNVLDRASP